jgi:hypothetical protein
MSSKPHSAHTVANFMALWVPLGIAACQWSRPFVSTDHALGYLGEGEIYFVLVNIQYCTGLSIYKLSSLHRSTSRSDCYHENSKVSW